MSGQIFIETAIGEEGKCKYYKAPSCHPCQVDPNNWIYCCYHPVYHDYDFEPMTLCGGFTSQCEIGKCAVAYRRGLALRLKNAKAKIVKLEEAIMEIDYLTSKGGRA